MRPYRRDQDAVGLEPLRQGFGICLIAAVTRMRSKCRPPPGYQNRPQHHLGIVASELFSAGPALSARSGNAHMVRTVPQSRDRICGLITRTGADLERPVMLLQLQLFGHISHHEGLADGLPAGIPSALSR